MKKKVLVLDTSELICFTIGRILENYGIETIEPENADYLLKNGDKFGDLNLIILDCSMLMPDGYMVLEKIKTCKALNHIPVIVLASYRDTECLQIALQKGAIGIIRKPFSEHHIVEEVNHILGPSDNVKDLVTIIRKEVNRAERGEYPFSVIGINIEDNMCPAKQLQILNKLKGAIREIDTVCVDRTLGMIVVLPFTEANAVSVVGTKIRNILVQAKCPDINCTFVTFPQDGENENILINKINKQLGHGNRCL